MRWCPFFVREGAALGINLRAAHGMTSAARRWAAAAAGRGNPIAPRRAASDQRALTTPATDSVAQRKRAPASRRQAERLGDLLRADSSSAIDVNVATT
jgi:hypothetical protein